MRNRQSPTDMDKFTSDRTHLYSRTETEEVDYTPGMEVDIDLDTISKCFHCKIFITSANREELVIISVFKYRSMSQIIVDRLTVSVINNHQLRFGQAMGLTMCVKRAEVQTGRTLDRSRREVFHLSS